MRIVERYLGANDLTMEKEIIYQVKKKHFGILAGDGSHLKVMLAVANKLRERGHKITIYQILDNEKKIRDEGFGFSAYGKEALPLGTLEAQSNCINRLREYDVLEKVCEMYLEQMKIIFDEVPDLLKIDKVDLLIVDAVFPEGGTVAEMVGIPFVNINAALITHQEIGIPCGWDYLPFDKSIRGYIRNYFSYKHINRIYFDPRVKLINKYRRKNNLKQYKRFEDCFSVDVQITQEIKEFEFPRKKLPESVKFVGLIENEEEEKDVEFIIKDMDNRPIVFVSMGTLLNNNFEIIESIANACVKLPVQLIIGFGGQNPKLFPKLKGNPILLSYAPQRTLLKHASIFVTHAGLNSTNEAIKEGVPMIAIPLSFEQPGIAQRIEWLGIGKVILPKEINETKILKSLKEVLYEESYKNKIRKLSKMTNNYGGAEEAALLIEEQIERSLGVN